MDQVIALAFSDEMQKIASTRLQREILSGRLSPTETARVARGLSQSDIGLYKATGGSVGSQELRKALRGATGKPDELATKPDLIARRDAPTVLSKPKVEQEPSAPADKMPNPTFASMLGAGLRL